MGQNISQAAYSSMRVEVLVSILLRVIYVMRFSFISVDYSLLTIVNLFMLNDILVDVCEKNVLSINSYKHG